ncbi:MAG: glycosyltransferase family 2 protein [Muribaculaceae bacterium]|nr:glycosyltransferase family 2 protein [Muribaculaceae bacterium]
MPTISVVMPMYNASSRVGRALESIVAQTFGDFELIVVDDGSSDDSVAIVQAIIDSSCLNDRARILRHDCNRGCAAARKTGMLAATGDYIIHVDADDYVEPDYLEHLHSEAVRTDADVVICDIVREWPCGKREVLSTPTGKTTDEYLAFALSGEMYCSLCNKLIRRSIFVNNEIWPIEGLNMLDDKSVVVRVFYYAVSFAVVDKVLYHYDKGNSSITNQNRSTHIDAFKRYNSLVDDFFDNHAHPRMIDEGLMSFKVISLSQKLIYSKSEIEKEESDFLSMLTLSDILTNKVCPPLYKIAIMSKKYGFGLLLMTLRLCVSLWQTKFLSGC